jgi:hypothetical protein
MGGMFSKKNETTPAPTMGGIFSKKNETPPASTTGQRNSNSSMNRQHPEGTIVHDQTGGRKRTVKKTKPKRKTLTKKRACKK